MVMPSEQRDMETAECQKRLNPEGLEKHQVFIFHRRPELPAIYSYSLTFSVIGVRLGNN
jgi:hypothetical protein